MPGSSRLDFDSIRLTTLRPFGLILIGPTQSGQSVELQMGFSLRGKAQAAANLSAEVPDPERGFDSCRVATENRWREHLERIHVQGGSSTQRSVFATALYHSLIKPCFAPDESPFWGSSKAFVFDICTMWDIYKTQLPLLTAIAPDRAVELVQALLSVVEEEGNFPIGYRMARGADRFFRQASALAHTLLADICDLELGSIDWDNALVHMHTDLRRSYGEDFLEHGVAHPIIHTLDLAYGYHCTARVARRIGDGALADQLDALATNWVNAFDPATGLLVDSTYYEGGRWNYSFRLLHDMAARIDLAGGDGAFVELLDRFFGFGAAPAVPLGPSPHPADVRAGDALNRFEGLNNEPDMEAPYAYHYAGRPDRTAEVIHAVLTNQFGTGRGGLPGNDDSGGLSSWYVWASLGLFPVAGQNQFLVSTPAFSRSCLTIGGSEFVVRTSGFEEPNQASEPQYVQQAWLNGKPLERCAIAGNHLHTGGELHLQLGPAPTKWGHDLRPRSVSTNPPRAN